MAVLDQGGCASWPVYRGARLMVQSHPNIIAGRTLAVVATLSWALNSIAPYVTAADRIFGSITAPKA
jgi:hypothetical protein